MRLRTVTLAAVGIVAVLVGPPLEARAGSTGFLAPCQIENPSGIPISMQIIANLNSNAFASLEIVDSFSVLVYYRGETYGPFTATNIPITGAGNQMEAACMVFNNQIPGTNRSLSDKILSAVGLRGRELKFTACSFLGPVLVPGDPFGDCTPSGNAGAPPGTPPGFQLGLWSGLVVGYATRGDRDD